MKPEDESGGSPRLIWVRSCPPLVLAAVTRHCDATATAFSSRLHLHPVK